MNRAIAISCQCSEKLREKKRGQATFSHLLSEVNLFDFRKYNRVLDRIIPVGCFALLDFPDFILAFLSFQNETEKSNPPSAEYLENQGTVMGDK